MTDELEDLVTTLEEIREEKYPEIPDGLVRQIVEIEFDSIDERSQAQSQVRDVIESHLEEEK